MISNDFQWFSMISTRYHIVGLALRVPNCIVSLFFGPFCFSCVLGRFPNGFPILWFSIGIPICFIMFYTCFWFSYTYGDFHMLSHIVLVLFRISDDCYIPCVFLVALNRFSIISYDLYDYHDFLRFQRFWMDSLFFHLFEILQINLNPGLAFHVTILVRCQWQP